MGLTRYRQKRDFQSTPEPSGKRHKSKGRGRLYVIQKLLRKIEDKAARPVEEFDVLQQKPKSVATRRSLEQIAASKPRTRNNHMPTTTQRPIKRTSHPVKRDNSGEAGVIAGVRLTHPDRVLYPEQGLTKRDLAGYYAEIGDWILPYVVDRPLTIVRCPQGPARQCFYQKHVRAGLPAAVKSVEVPEKNGTGQYVTISNLKGLVTLVQFGVLEFHPWGSRNDLLDKPDRLIFDLDPAPDVAWADVVSAAKDLHERLEGLGLTTFLRTTGGKGLHVVAPLVRRIEWQPLKSLARSIALALEREQPGKYISVSTKAKRAGKIFVDYLRNNRGATAIASYSTRARPGATVATPLHWNELTARLKPQQFNVQTIPKRLARLGEDPWREFHELRQSVTAAMLRDVKKL